MVITSPSTTSRRSPIQKPDRSRPSCASPASRLFCANSSSGDSYDCKRQQHVLLTTVTTHIPSPIPRDDSLGPNRTWLEPSDGLLASPSIDGHTEPVPSLLLLLALLYLRLRLHLSLDRPMSPPHGHTHQHHMQEQHYPPPPSPMPTSNSSSCWNSAASSSTSRCSGWRHWTGPSGVASGTPTCRSAPLRGMWSVPP